MMKTKIAGLHPAGDTATGENCSVITWTLGHLFLVPAETGASDGDLEDKYVTARYRVLLTASEYKRVAAHIKQLQADSPMWNALIKNCVSFGGDIAKFMNLKTPGFIWLQPKEYVTQLREMNGVTVEQKPLRFANGTERSSAATPAPKRSNSSTTETSVAASATGRPSEQLAR